MVEAYGAGDAGGGLGDAGGLRPSCRPPSLFRHMDPPLSPLNMCRIFTVDEESDCLRTIIASESASTAQRFGTY